MIAKEPGLEKYLIYDDYQRKSLIDHVLPRDTEMNAFYEHSYREAGDFVNGAYKLIAKSIDDDAIILTLARDGNCQINGVDGAVKVIKKVSILRHEEIVTIDYTIINLNDQPISFDFAVEFNFGLQAGHADDRYYYYKSGRPETSWLDSCAAVSGESFIGLKDEYMRIDIRVEAPGNKALWHVPVETISLSEAGFERVYQSSAVLAVYAIDLSDEAHFSLTQKLATF